MKKTILIFLLGVSMALQSADADPDQSKQGHEAFCQFSHELMKNNQNIEFKLNLEWPNHVHVAPNILPSLKGIVFLQLGNFLDSIPEDIGALNHLKDLRLSVNDFGAVPKTIKDIESLRKLTVCHAHGIIPDFISDMTQLTELSFHCSNCDSLRKKTLIKLSNLLSFYDTDKEYRGLPLKAYIDSLPETEVEPQNTIYKRATIIIGTGTNIVKLELNGWYIIVPKELYQLSGLKHVRLHTFVKKLPEGIANLRKLKKLELSLGHADDLPADLSKAESILTLGIAHVKEGDFIAKLPPSIENLNVHCSEVREADFAGLPRLLYLKELAGLENSYGFNLKNKSGHKLGKKLREIAMHYAQKQEGVEKNDGAKANALLVLSLKSAHDLLLDKQKDIELNKADPALAKAYGKCLSKLGNVVALVSVGKNT